MNYTQIPNQQNYIRTAKAVSHQIESILLRAPASSDGALLFALLADLEAAVDGLVDVSSPQVDRYRATLDTLRTEVAARATQTATYASADVAVKYTTETRYENERYNLQNAHSQVDSILEYC